MSTNPLLGSRISLISRKNIRYEGTLYSISETDATIALQNVRSYGTEGRERIDNSTFHPPQDDVLPFLLFRGCDIKDLHVHESSAPASPKPAPSNEPTAAAKMPVPQSSNSSSTPALIRPEAPNMESKSRGAVDKDHGVNTKPSQAKTEPGKAQTNTSRAGETSTNPRSSSCRRNNMIGSGASLLTRKTRGTVTGVQGPNKDISSDFDFETNLEHFIKSSGDSNISPMIQSNNTKNETLNSSAAPALSRIITDTHVYSKDDFFDSISCDVLDRQRGIDTRLRGSQERTLNTETFGATSLSHSLHRNYTGGRGGRGRSGRTRGSAASTDRRTNGSAQHETKENQRTNQTRRNNHTINNNSHLNATPTTTA